MKRGIMAFALGSLMLTGCASIGEQGSAAAPSGGMDQFRLERLFENQVEKVDGGAGYLRTRVDGADVYLISNPDTDRVQLIVGVPVNESVGVQHLVGMLNANFQPGLDARYALSDGVIFSIFVHRLTTLTEEDFVAGYRQALDLAKRFDEVADGIEIEGRQ